MSDDEYHRFLKRWAMDFFNLYDTPEYSNLDRRDDNEDWSKGFLSHYDNRESEREMMGDDVTIALIEKVTSDFFSYIDEVEEESKKSKKKR